MAMAQESADVVMLRASERLENPGRTKEEGAHTSCTLTTNQGIAS